MNKDWIEVNLEKTRKMMFQSNPGQYLELTNVTHYKKREHGYMLKCDQGIIYFEKDDVSHIISNCTDWVA